MNEQEEVAYLRHLLRDLDEWKAAKLAVSPEVKSNLMDKIDKDGDEWNWTASLNSDGYPKMKDEGKLRLASHIVLETQGRSVPAGKVVMHKDNNPKNVHPSNLMIGTQQQNLRQMRNEGRDRPRGVAQEPDVKTAGPLSMAEEKMKDMAEAAFRVKAPKKIKVAELLPSFAEEILHGWLGRRLPPYAQARDQQAVP